MVVKSGRLAHEHVGGFSPLTVDLHPRNARGDLGGIEVGKLGNVLGDHGSYDLVGIAADIADRFE